MPLIRPSWWDGIKHFKSEEFDSPDIPGSGAANMREPILVILDMIRERVGFPMRINSGYRTALHNETVGGKPMSAHLTGFAADVAVRDNYQRFMLVREALAVGVHRVGIAKTFVHLDTAPGLPVPGIWLY